MLVTGDTIAFVGLSDPRHEREWIQLETLKNFFASYGVNVFISPLLYEMECSRPAWAKELMRLFEHPDVKAIFDVSGGNLANGILPYLDFERIRQAEKPFFGYSDLTSVLNAIYTMTGKPSYLFQLRTLCWSQAKQQQARLVASLFEQRHDLFDVQWEWLSRERMQGVVVGGNVRCFLKLAGTPYFPDLTERLLFLESYGGKENLIRSYFYQLAGMGAFQKASGLMLGTFTELEKEGGRIEDIVHEVVPADLPVVKTRQIGHGEDSRALVIGETLQLERGDSHA